MHPEIFVFVINTPTHSGKSCAGSPAVFAHLDILQSFHEWAGWRNSSQSPKPRIFISGYLRSHIQPLRRMSGLVFSTSLKEAYEAVLHIQYTQTHPQSHPASKNHSHKKPCNPTPTISVSLNALSLKTSTCPTNPPSCITHSHLPPSVIGAPSHKRLCPLQLQQEPQECNSICNLSRGCRLFVMGKVLCHIHCTRKDKWREKALE